MAKFDAYELVTEKILALLKTHGANWIKCFGGLVGRLPRSAMTGKDYSAINALLLWGLPYSDTRWATYNGWKKFAKREGLTDNAGQVKKGEKASHIFCWKMILVKDEDDPTQKKEIPFLRWYTVFNAEQVHGIPLEKVDARPDDITERVAYADRFLSALKADVRYSDAGLAYYHGADDYIHMPNRELFVATNGTSATENFYSTLAHEHVHWTGSSKRLDRKKGGFFGGAEYAFEELVAEIGAAYLSHKLGISHEPTQSSAEYLNHWIRGLEDDKRAITRAATQAKNAVMFMEELAEPEAGIEELAA